MLPRDERLTTAEFARVWEAARPLRHPLLTVRAVRRQDEEGSHNRDAPAAASLAPGSPARCAFVVTRKSGKATERNRIRRRVRECYRLSAARSAGTLRGHSVVFLINAARADASLEEWTAAFNELAPRIVREARALREPRLARERDRAQPGEQTGVQTAHPTTPAENPARATAPAARADCRNDVAGGAVAGGAVAGGAVADGAGV